MNKSINQSYISNPFKVIFKGFDALFKHNQTMAIVILVVGLIGGIGQFFNGFGGGSSGSDIPMTNSPAAGDPLNVGAIVAIVIGVIIVALLVIAIITLIATIYTGAVAYVAHKTIKGETTTFSETMSAVFKKFWTIVWTGVIVDLKVFGGFLLFVIPGIRASLRYNMVLLPIFADNANAKQAIATSKQITKDHLIEIWGMEMAAGIIPFIGHVFQLGGQIVMYPQLKALKASGAPKPPVHWLNYLVFIIVGGIFALFFLTAIIIAVIASAT